VVWLNKNNWVPTQADQTTITGRVPQQTPLKDGHTVIGDISLPTPTGHYGKSNNIAQNQQ